MKTKIKHPQWPVRGVTILELMVAVSLISFIILALYQMFDRTQGLMRGAVREADKFENGRAAMDILRRDLSQMGYVKTLFDSGAGAVTNWPAVVLPPTPYNAGTYYPAGSVVFSGVNAYFAVRGTQGSAPSPVSSSPWALAAPNFRISEFAQVASPLVLLSSGGNPLLTNTLHDVFFMYFDPLIRTTVTPSGSIMAGSSYVASNTLTYAALARQPGDPFFGRTGIATYTGGANRAVLVEGGWRAVGYRVASSTNASILLGSAGPGPQVGTLYRYELGTLDNDARRMWLGFTNFAGTNFPAVTSVFQRVAENVVHFRCQAVTGNGSPFELTPGTGSLLMLGTNVPSLVQVELGIIDAKVAGQVSAIGTTNYFVQQGDSVQIFRQQIAIRLGQQ
ncbi:MAG: hypothetical protein EBS05_02410 [Proteobacteria bacterium]|nr:hypothetical protein [Pseudomonadota bacterium]